MLRPRTSHASTTLSGAKSTTPPSNAVSLMRPRRIPKQDTRKKTFKRKNKEKDDEDTASHSGGSAESPKAKKGKKFPEKAESMHTFLGTPSVRQEKAALCELNATVPAVPQYLNWSEVPITWDRSDNPDYIPEPGKYALVVAPYIDDYKLSKVLMDGGSSINIMYRDTLKRMHLSETQLRHNNVRFHGIVLG